MARRYCDALRTIEMLAAVAILLAVSAVHAHVTQVSKGGGVTRHIGNKWVLMQQATPEQDDLGVAPGKCSPVCSPNGHCVNGTCVCVQVCT